MAGFTIDRLDHLVITVRDIEATLAFYGRTLGMRREIFEGGRVSLHFGRQKINVHPYPSDVEIVAKDPRPGTADLCFVTEAPIDDVVAHLAACDVPVEMGPIARSGALGPMTSVYIRDPDENLIEISVYDR